MKCPICETNNISIDEEMCNPCYVEDMYMNSERGEFIPFETIEIGLAQDSSYLYDEDDYKSRSEIALGVD